MPTPGYTPGEATIRGIDMKYILFFLLFFTVTVLIAANTPRNIDVDDRTKLLCAEYAARDHEKEIAPERYKALGKKFFDEFDWYNSCLDHVRYPVAK